MVNEEFTDDDFEDDTPKPQQQPTREIRSPGPPATISKKPTPSPIQPRPIQQPQQQSPQPRPIQQPPQQPQQRQAQVQQPEPPATRDVAAPTEKYSPYSMPSRIGVFDNELGRPILEDTDITGVMFALLTKIANDVEEIKGRL